MIVNRQRAARLARRPLESFLRRMKSELGLRDADLTVCLVSDAEIARMNEKFRKKKGPTDVLSFPTVARRTPVRLSVRSGKQRSRGREHAGTRHESENFSSLATRHWPLYLGDIAISPATARRYAKKNGRTLSSEIRVLMLHGVLHLLGYDHETDRGQMDRVERKLRKRFGLA